MRKLIVLSSPEALLITSALSHWAFHCSNQLSTEDKHIASQLLDDLDMCDQIRKRLNHAFDFSIVNFERSKHNNDTI